MKMIYEKGFPLLLAVTIAIQELKWGEVPISYAATILVCIVTMLCMIAYEKKQWNVLIGCGVLLLSAGAIIYMQDILEGKAVYWLLAVFAVQYVVLACFMNFLYVKCIFSFSFLIAFVVLRLCYVPILSGLVTVVLLWFLISSSELIHMIYYKKQQAQVQGIRRFHTPSKATDETKDSFQDMTQKTESRRTLGLLPVFILLFLCILIIPVKSQPFDWSFLVNPVTNVYEGIRNTIQDIKDHWNQEESFFSYQLNQDEEESDGENVLGGSVNPTDRVLLKVSGNRSSSNSLYLTGSVYDTYSGTGWTKHMKGEQSEQDEYVLARTEIESAANTQGWKQVEDEYVFRERMLDIKYARMHTKTIFYPSYLSEFSTISKAAKKNVKTANIYYNKARKRGYTYRAYYNEINLDSSYVKDYLRTLDSYAFEDEELKGRAEEIQQEYTALPDSVPERVKDLAGQITSEEGSSYDKMNIICQYLRGFEYSKKVKKVSDKHDFVDDFLWNTKKGYCTYFATAAAVLGRSIGIPTRYVEGMVVTQDCKQDEDYYLLDGNSMHAWCEAYFKGFGWVRFEATPGYTEKGGAWERTSGRNYYEKEPEPSTAVSVATEDIKPQEKEKKTTLAWRWAILALVCMVVAVLIITVLCIWNERKERTRKERCIRLFGHLMFYLKKLGFVLEKGETLIAFRNRVNDGMKFDKFNKYEPFEQSIAIYLKLRFGEMEPTEEELKEMECMNQILREICKEKMGRIHYSVIWLEEKMKR